MQKLSYIPKYTYEDYQHWEDPWELIEGIPYAMTPLPSIRHQNLSGNIHFQLKSLLKTCGQCRAFLPINWKISEDTILQPDNCVVCDEIVENYLTHAPILIFEILSPSTALKDKNIKYQLYQEQGVQYYIIVNPQTNGAEVFELKKQSYEKLADVRNETILFNLGECQISFDFSQIWD